MVSIQHLHSVNIILHKRKFLNVFRLRTINESAHSMLSDDEYDKTEDDLHTTYLRSGRRFKRPSAPPLEEDLPKKRKSGEDVSSHTYRIYSSISTSRLQVGSTF